MSVLQSMQYATATTWLHGARPEKRVPMTRIRARIAERLLEVTTKHSHVDNIQ